MTSFMFYVILLSVFISHTRYAFPIENIRNKIIYFTDTVLWLNYYANITQILTKC